MWLEHPNPTESNQAPTLPTTVFQTMRHKIQEKVSEDLSVQRSSFLGKQEAPTPEFVSLFKLLKAQRTRCWRTCRVDP